MVTIGFAYVAVGSDVVVLLRDAVVDLDEENVLAGRSQRVRDVVSEERETAFVLAELASVEPDIRDEARRLEFQPFASASGRRFEFEPVPADTPLICLSGGRAGRIGIPSVG